MMDDFTVAIYCFIDDYGQISKTKEDVKRKLNDAEVITIAIVSARYFSSNLTKGFDCGAVKGWTKVTSILSFPFASSSKYSHIILISATWLLSKRVEYRFHLYHR